MIKCVSVILAIVYIYIYIVITIIRGVQEECSQSGEMGRLRLEKQIKNRGQRCLWLKYGTVYGADRKAYINSCPGWAIRGCI